MKKKISLLISATALIVLAFSGCRNTAAGSMVSSAVNYGNNVTSQAASNVQRSASSFLVTSAVSGV
ncbi:MAG TPA: hypothetical protein VHO71_05410 [Caproiciproducens sp.]|nr:hypothetical protein [Caproiciproducens sp.]